MYTLYTQRDSTRLGRSNSNDLQPIQPLTRALCQGGLVSTHLVHTDRFLEFTGHAAGCGGWMRVRFNLGARPTYVHTVVQPVVDECTWESRSYKVTSRRADRRVDTVSSGVEGPYSPARANVASGREKACRGRVRRNCQILKLVLDTELEARCTAHTPSLHLGCWNWWDVVPAVACPRSWVILVVTFDVRPRLRRKCRGV